MKTRVSKTFASPINYSYQSVIVRYVIYWRYSGSLLKRIGTLPPGSAKFITPAWKYVFKVDAAIHDRARSRALLPASIWRSATNFNVRVFTNNVRIALNQSSPPPPGRVRNKQNSSDGSISYLTNSNELTDPITFTPDLYVLVLHCVNLR
jgi:hypothetical protein